MPRPSSAAAPGPPAAAPPASLRFGRFELQPRAHRLLRDGEPVPLGGRAFDLLLALAGRPGELLMRQELIDAVWPGRVVEENNLSVQVNALRKVLGSDVLVTVPGRGYRLVAAPSAPPAPAATETDASAATPPRTHLPAAQPLLIGRSDELVALGRLVGQHRLVTVVGPGGIGKTRLAQALLPMRAAGYLHGVCWVEMGSITDADALPGAVALALGVQPGAGDALAALAQSVGGMQLLLALDNAEHLLEPVARLAQTLLDAAPGLHLVVTSQAPLRLALERVFRLGPLAIPPQTLPARQAQAFSAVALFAERAAAADNRFVLTDAQVPAVIALCRALDGVALAIELAAARAAAIGVERLQAAMADRLRVFTANRNRYAPQRQQTLRAAVAWSHDLLEESGRRLFRRLAVLRGGATLDLVQAVAADPPGDGPLDDWALLDALDTLAQRSLVETHLDEDARPRYRLLETPRLFALEQLAASGEEAAVRERHAHAVRAAWDGLESALQAGTIGVDAWRRDVGVELDGARDALQWARCTGDDTLALALASAMVTRLPPALAHERQQLAGLCRSLVDRVPQDPALQQRAWAAITLLGSDAAAAGASLALARRLGDPARLYLALCDMARTTPHDPRGDRAEELLHEARTIEDATWPPVRRRAAARIEAIIAARRGDTARAVMLWRHVLALSQAAGDPSMATRVNLADLELQAGAVTAAIAALRALEGQLAGGRNEHQLALVRLCLAAAHLRRDDPEAACEPLQRAWSILASKGRDVLCAEHLALLAALQRRHETAALLLGAADAQRAATGVVCESNAARAREQCRQRIDAALGSDRACALILQGSRLRTDDVARLAFPPAA